MDTELQLAKQLDSQEDKKKYFLSHCHGGSRFCSWRLAFTNLV